MSFELGPCELSYDGADLGSTEGGVTIKMAEDTADLKSDQTGTQPVDQVVTGTSGSIECSLATISLENFALAHKSNVIVDGTDPNKKKVIILPNVGTSLRDNAKVLIVKPYVNGVVTADANKWYTFPMAGIKAEDDVVYNVDTQRTIKVTFTAYADDNSQIAIIGDETATP